MPIDQTHAANERHDKYVLNMAGSADRRYAEALRLLSQAASILRDRSGIEPTSTNPVAPNIVEDTNVAVVRPSAELRNPFAPYSRQAYQFNRFTSPPSLLTSTSPFC